MISEPERLLESLGRETEQANIFLPPLDDLARVGPVSDGSCKKCGEIGRLKNSIDDECE